MPSCVMRQCFALWINLSFTGLSYFVIFVSFSVTAFEIMPLSLLLDIGLYLNEKYFVKLQSYQKCSVAFIHMIAETEVLRGICVLAKFVCFPLSYV